MENKKTFYITTPIYYPNDKLHIGHSYCTVGADCMARYKKMMGFDTYFLTGTDEHGLKIQRSAEKAGVDPQTYVDNIVDGIQKLWKVLEISNDDFIRTTQDRHVKLVQKIFRKLYDQGDIYKGHYEGWYCTPCESFWTQSQLVDGKCPDCGRDVEKAKEECYFLRISKYGDWLLSFFKENPDFLLPASRANEMVKNFIEPGLEDLCVSRTTFTWGVPVEFDPGHVVYVWVDALSNYISALGYDSEDDSLYRKFWPADIHFVGKDIVRFHTIIWPIMLHMLDLPLPKQVLGHGLLNLNGGKMSKSKGNVVDPVKLIERYGVDAIRYYLLREMPFGADGNFTNEALVARINMDLANDLGNLVHRTVAMITKYFDGVMPEPKAYEEMDEALKSEALKLSEVYCREMEQMHFSVALTEVFKLISSCNRYIDQTAPWALAKDPEKKERLGTVLYNLAECIRRIALCLVPVMVHTPEKIFAELGVDGEAATWTRMDEWGVLPSGMKVAPAAALFPRLDPDAEMEALEAMLPKKEEEYTIAPAKEEIDIETFGKLDLRVATVVAAEKVKKANKLLQLTLKLGSETRTVVSGIAEAYKPEDMIGRQVIVVYNLKPAKLRGIESQGMILAASDPVTGKLNLLAPSEEIHDGAVVS